MEKKNLHLIDNEKGQVSIFLGIILLVVISFIAFVINVGLFVKAKINLQNAVDAAAYSGAAVQARQLTSLGHLNWELRNTYKEWMFKYYVLGQVGLDAIDNIDGNEPPPDGYKLNNQGMNFRLRQFKGNRKQYYNKDIFDLYNLPSTCIHYGSNNNICEIVSIPGLPRFNTVGLPSISEQHESLLNSIVATKAEDCSSRSNINQGAAMLWAYGTENNNLFDDVPQIAADRTGAWVQAIEISMRMRNLERIMNEPPVTNFICTDPQSAPGRCTRSINELSGSGNSYPFHERTVKAFYSAYRNLSGGASKDNRDGNPSGGTIDFGSRFRMRELPPTPFQAGETSLSGFLIPTGNPALEKHYVDIQLYPVNLVTFYTTFVSGSGSFRNSGTKSEADCGGTKTALPVPGYIMGFSKNPELLTYYAVEGESDFTGLFYPFLNDQQGITLKTYAAAKPFGGRIGPALFKVQNGQTLVARDDPSLKLSSNYTSAINVSDIPPGGIKAGYPIPTDQDFWVNNSSNVEVGGTPTTSGQVYFAIPNLIYDFDDYSELNALRIDADNIQVLRRAINDSAAYQNPVPEAGFGLYNIEQFRKFAANKVTPPSGILASNDILQSIYNVRRPTKYEALNYLVPVMDYEGTNQIDIDQSNLIHPLPNNPVGAQNSDTKLYRIFAPIIGQDSLYTSPVAVTSIIEDYINANQSAVEKYSNALREVADGMRLEATTSTSGDAYLAAANSIHKEPAIVSGGAVGSPECLGLSMSQKFNMFFSTSGAGCGITPISDHITKYFNDKLAEANTAWDNYYTSVYTKPSFDEKLLLSGYKPGPRQGATSDDRGGSPFISTNLRLMKRNSYSTKFIPMSSIVSSQATYGPQLSIFAEGNQSLSFERSEMHKDLTIQNLIPDEELADYSDLWF